MTDGSLTELRPDDLLHWWELPVPEHPVADIDQCRRAKGIRELVAAQRAWVKGWYRREVRRDIERSDSAKTDTSLFLWRGRMLAMDETAELLGLIQPSPTYWLLVDKAEIERMQRLDAAGMWPQFKAGRPR